MICYVLVLNYSMLLSKKKSLLISRKESVNTPQSRGTKQHNRDSEKNQTSANSLFALNCTSSTLYHNLLKII